MRMEVEMCEIKLHHMKERSCSEFSVTDELNED